jgi:Family of unknown function (DUF6526)
MADTAPQSLENHTRVVPAYHMGIFAIFMLNLVWSLYRLVKYPSADTIVSLLLAVGLILLAFYARVFALTVQDRVIRLEMQLRLRQMLPADLQARIDELTPKQLVALRFASDEELPGLCRTVLNDKVGDQKSIKKMIKKWRPDHLRA